MADPGPFVASTSQKPAPESVAVEVLHIATPAAPEVAAETQALLEIAGRAKAELNRRIRKLYDEEGRIRDRQAFDAMRHDREHYAIHNYLPAINALREIGQATLLEIQAVLLGRLNRGWAMHGLDEDGHRLFADLLCQYESVNDALSGDVLMATLDRLDGIEQAVP